MSFGSLSAFAFAIIFLDVFLKMEGKMFLQVPADTGCTRGRKFGLFRHNGVSACTGTWNGHVNQASLCSEGWHVCNWNDTEKLSAISYYEASHIDGCFAINAAQNNGLCQECSSQADELAGIGADCPISNTKSSSCIGSGRIDSSCCSVAHGHDPCVFRQWMTGAVCCQDKKTGSPPTIRASPVSSARVQAGEDLTITCKADGVPAPIITWYKNGYPASTEGLRAEDTTTGNTVVSKLMLSESRTSYDGLYLCRAENSNGVAISYTSDVTTYQAKPSKAACRKLRHQTLLNGASVAACAGSWKGGVRHSGKQLCAKGWRICGLKDLSTLHRLTWEEISSLKGCYAYNAATSDNFACTKCSHRQKGNSMSGIGADCGMHKKGLNSCLHAGRVDVWARRNPTNAVDVEKKHATNACRYTKGKTSGVMCCKIEHKKKIHASKHKKSCKTPCGANSHCSRRGVCKCDKGFKFVGETCAAKRRVKPHKSLCSKVRCKNGGTCKKGFCVCPPTHRGRHCERVATLSSSLH